MRPPLTPVETQRRVVLRLLEKKQAAAAAPAPKRSNAPGRPPRSKAMILAALDEKITSALGTLHRLQAEAGMPLTPLASLKVVRKATEGPRPGRPALPASVKLKRQIDTLVAKLDTLKAMPDAAFAVIHTGGGRPKLTRKQRMEDLQQKVAELKREFREVKAKEDQELKKKLQEARQAEAELAAIERQRQELEARLAALSLQTRKVKVAASR